MKKALACIANPLPYQCYGITRTALWGEWGIDVNERLSDYKKRLLPENLKKQTRKKLDLKFSLALTLFKSNNITEALRSMYVFGHPRIIIPAEYREIIYIEDPKYHDDACYRVIFYVYAKYTVTLSNDIFTIEKKRVSRLKYALDYIYNKEPHLYAYFFEKK